MNTRHALKAVTEQYQAGLFREAERLCKKILKYQPANFDAIQYLGAIYYQLKDYDSAIHYFNKALQVSPTHATIYYNIANAFKDKGQHDAAIKYYQQALQQKPLFVEAHNNLGIVFKTKGLFEEAARCFHKSIAYNPRFLIAYINLGDTLNKQGCYDEAITYAQKAIEINPNISEAYNIIGNALQYQGNYDAAITNYQKALKRKPDFAEIYNNLGVISLSKGLLDDAIEFFRIATSLDPKSSILLTNLGDAYRNKKQYEQAIDCLLNVLRVNPYFIDAYYRIGITFMDYGKFQEALAAFDMMLFMNPHCTKGFWAKCMAQLPIIYYTESDIQCTHNRYRDELLTLRDTLQLSTQRGIEDAFEAIGDIRPFYLAYQGMNDRVLQQRYGEIFCNITAARYPHIANPPHVLYPTSQEQIRIGFISGFFYNHSNWKIPIKGWIENLDRRRFNLFGYYTRHVEDKETEAARHYFTRFVEGVYSFESLCQIIRADNLHVLIYPEIGMDPITAKLAALRLAPVQCTSWGHPDTSGFPTIDYYISSDLMEPPEADSHYTEKLIRLPNLSVFYTPLNVPPAQSSRATFSLREHSIVYLCCQSLFKYLPHYDEIYPRIAKEMGDCQFVFISHQSSHITEQFRGRIRQAFGEFALNADDYIVILPRLDPSQYHAINRLSDIYLDSIGWSGCNSTFEAIACDLPVVTLPGEFMRGRHSWAILTMMGVTETIASTKDEYIALAVRLGQDKDWRQQISGKITANKHRVYRDRAPITALESFLEQAVQRYA